MSYAIVDTLTDESIERIEFLLQTLNNEAFLINFGDKTFIKLDEPM